jgi:glycosyltransferase involved in cell wall biosynthesis
MTKRVAHIVLSDFVNDNRVLRECLALREVGHEVEVFALKSARTQKHEVLEGIAVNRIALLTAFLPTAFNPLKFLEFSLRMTFKLRQYDILHCADFEPLIAASWSKRLRPSQQIVYDAHEYALEKNGISAFQRRFVALFEKSLVKRCAAVITVSHGIAAEYQRLYAVPKVHVILNVPFASEPYPNNNYLRDRFDIGPDQLIFLYQGKFLTGRGVGLLIDAFKLLQDSKAVLVFVGSGPLQNEVEAATGDGHVFFHEAVPYKELAKVTAAADFGIVSVENVCLSYYFCMPNKMFEYIQAELPILTTNLHDCRILVEEQHLGLVIPDFTPESFAATIRKACNTDRSTFAAGLTRNRILYHWENEKKKLVAIYREL